MQTHAQRVARTLAVLRICALFESDRMGDAILPIVLCAGSLVAVALRDRLW